MSKDVRVPAMLLLEAGEILNRGSSADVDLERVRLDLRVALAATLVSATEVIDIQETRVVVAVSKNTTHFSRDWDPQRWGETLGIVIKKDTGRDVEILLAEPGGKTRNILAVIDPELVVEALRAMDGQIPSPTDRERIQGELKRAAAFALAKRRLES